MTRSRSLLRSAIVLLSACALILSGCGSSGKEASGTNDTANKKSAIKQQSYFIFDTIVTVKIYDERADQKQFKDIENLLNEIDSRLNRTKDTSELAKIHAASGKEAVTVTPESFDLIAKSLDYAKRTEGRFDPTVGPIVDLWNIGHENAKVPNPDKLAQTLKLVNYKDVTLDPAKHAIKLNREGMELDMGSIGKGYAADRIADYLRNNGFPSAIIDLGGNIFAVGAKPGGSDWTIGVQDPDETRGNQIGKMKVQDKTIVTSGVYERYFVENGKHYHHILDPATGYPVDNGLSSVTIVTNSSTDADALSTSLFALGVEKGLKFVEEDPNVEAIFITTDHKVYCTSGIKEIFELTNDKYKIVN
ncbi:FAD:protein FMN transferase [Paenibacillus alvei]|uniref:FAD:protein FMN transferase n=1 Tax=Paenibacillus alvei TaxID=44250 RepID=UPI0013DA845A|nr:FAD:protein FMN transferase [Paenibacillus alvei]NEZ44839.1 FAD:protein FMN transferase [Paenibacillus alvei]